jgi:hypothetical protein
MQITTLAIEQKARGREDPHERVTVVHRFDHGFLEVRWLLWDLHGNS